MTYIRKYMIYCILLLLVVLTAYIFVNNQIKEVVTISFKDHHVDLKPLYYRDQPFKMFFESMDRIPEIPVGENLLIDLHDIEAESIEVLEYILDESGELRYSDKEIKSLPVQVINNQYFISLQDNLARLLSSKIEAYNYYGIEVVVTNQDKAESHLFTYKRPGVLSITDNRSDVDLTQVIKLIIDEDESDYTYIALDMNGYTDYKIDNRIHDYQVPLLYESLYSLEEKHLLVESSIKGILLKIETIVYSDAETCQIEVIKYDQLLEKNYYRISLKLRTKEWQIDQMTLE